MSPRVLCYAPYNRWALHGQWEMTILHAARLRGAEVHYVVCDGLYTDCDQFWAATTPRPADACISCQARVTALLAQMGMPYHWLGRYLNTDEGREARRWADALDDDELLDATYGSWRVGEWVRMSVQSHLRAVRLDVSDPAVARAMRSYVYSGLIACFALDRLIEETAPDVMVVFNGRQSSTRVALELARARGIRVLTHERGYRKETISLFENATCLTLNHVRRMWQDWGEVPLTEDELRTAATLMAEREHGREMQWTALSPPPQQLDELRARLGLEPGRPVWALFTSSDDELAGDPDWDSRFGSQEEWIRRTIEHARRHPEMDLVIRVHPNTGSRRSLGANQEQLAEMARLADGLPPNVRIVGADEEISSYTLMDLCSVGLVWVSTVGLELACKGKEVVVAAGNYVGDTSFTHTVSDPDRYEELLEALAGVPAGAVDPHIRRLGLRFAYGFFFRISVPFPLVRMPTPHDGVLAYSTLEELLPGREPGLDRAVRIVLDGEAVCLGPTDAERARGTGDEDRLLGLAPRRLTALAYADELLEDMSLLEAWAARFSGRDDVTLVIHTPADDTQRLVDAVGAAGLDREDGPDLMATELGPGALAAVDVLFSRIERDDVPVLPRFDDGNLGELAAAA